MTATNLRTFNRIALLALLLHGIVWIALPALLDGSIRRDVAEGVIDGPFWQLAYLRHPPLSSWLSGLASQAGPFRYIVLYGFSWLFSGGAFFLTGLFLARTASPTIGLLALFGGMLSPFGTYIPLNFNRNITVMFFWAASLATIWRAMRRDDLAAWLLAGLAVGIGLWAKYALLMLIGPIGLWMLTRADTRALLTSPKPWLAVALGIAVALPQLYQNIVISRTAFDYAVAGEAIGWPVRLFHCGEFLLNVALMQIALAVLAFVVSGKAVFATAWAMATRPHQRDRLGSYVTIAALGPVLVILIGTLLSRRAHFLWVTPLSVSFTAFWAYAAHACRTDDQPRGKALLRAALVYALVDIVAFTTVRFVAPITSKRPLNQEIDSRGLAALAEAYWHTVSQGPIPMIVSIGPGTQHGFQRAGGIVFDLPYRVNVLEDGEPKNAPWLDLAPLKEKGALIVSEQPIEEGFSVIGQTVADRQSFDLPTRRGARTKPIHLARVLPQGAMQP